MRDPLEYLDLGVPYYLIKHRLIQKYKGRAKRAISLVNKGKVSRKGRCHYLVHDRGRDYEVIEYTCTCQDFEQNGGPCAHIIAVKIVRSENPPFDSYDTEEDAWDAYYYETFCRR